MSDIIKYFLKNESGATAIEYALIAGTMATMLIVVFAALSTDITAAFTKIGTAIQ